MQFTAYPRETVLLDPRSNMQPRTIVSEIRLDPLTGRSSRICHFMALQWPRPDFEKMTAGTQANIMEYVKNQSELGVNETNIDGFRTVVTLQEEDDNRRLFVLVQQQGG